MPIVEVLLERLGDLHPHEQVIRAKALRVARSILETGYVLRPIIVEAGSHAILDGHHRAAALRMLGARLAPVVEARYGAEVEAMRPVARIPASMGRDPYRLADEIEKLASGRTRTVLVQGPLRIGLRVDLEEAYRATGLGRRGWAGALVILPPLSPRQVVESALLGEPYPPKTTNHATRLKSLYAPTRLSELL